ncbi:MAG TPA: nitrite reductase small subunit NirD [Candidatus Dormibacteraeota bacterium]|nr:nitrite reductase small subunit NirD [Candidatus Dormibacteraeota bacterium]
MKETQGVTRRWTRIAQCRDIPLREGRAVKVGNREIAIFNLGDRFLAVDNRCPHQGGPLADGIVSGGSVVCPLHAWKISLETGEGANRANSSSCVETFRTRVEHGVIFLEIAAPVVSSEGTSARDLPLLCVKPVTLADGEASCNHA